MDLVNYKTFDYEDKIFYFVAPASKPFFPIKFFGTVKEISYPEAKIFYSVKPEKIILPEKKSFQEIIHILQGSLWSVNVLCSDKIYRQNVIAFQGDDLSWFQSGRFQYIHCSMAFDTESELEKYYQKYLIDIKEELEYSLQVIDNL